MEWHDIMKEPVGVSVKGTSTAKNELARAEAAEALIAAEKADRDELMRVVGLKCISAWKAKLAEVEADISELADMQRADALEAARWRVIAEAAEAKLVQWQAAQHYSYIGKDGKKVLARDLEARAETAEAKLELLENEMTAVYLKGRADIEAMLPRVFRAGVKAAAKVAEYCGALRDQRDGSYAGSEPVMGPEVADEIRNLPTPPLAELLALKEAE